MQKKRLILDQALLDITLRRLCQEIIENHEIVENVVLIGLQPRGVFLAERIKQLINELFGHNIPLGYVDATFYRDDFKRKGNILLPNSTQIAFIIEDKNVILIDDVLATGRMVRAAMDALQAFGRPKKIELLCLIDRKYNRDLPIQPDYSGKKVNTLDTQKVLVEWKEQGHKADSIWLID
jgi:pyrimidine operon attenuation protein / uracil phosphoribosyltransferase